MRLNPLRGRSRKFIAIAATSTVGIIALAGAATAYYLVEASGSGTASAPLSSPSSAPVLVTVTSPITPLAPGSSEPVSYNIENDGSNPVQLNTVTTTIVSTSVPGCLTSWFSLVPATGATLPQSISEGGGSYAGTATLTFTNAAVDQGICSTATVMLKVTAS